MGIPSELRLVKERLLAYRGPDDDPPRGEGRRLASVALVVRPGTGSSEILLVKRARAERDPWSGDMAFPGGRWEEGDRSLLETAARETREETGLAPTEEGRLLGRLNVVAPRSPHLPPVSIVPFVFAVARGAEARVASGEIAEVHWIPVERFRDPRARTEHRFPGGDRVVLFPAFRVADRIVWGLTHRILEDFLSRLP